MIKDKQTNRQNHQFKVCIKKIKPNPQFLKRDRLHQTHHAVNLTQRHLSLLVIPPAVPTPLTPVQAQLISAVACVGSYCLVEQGALWFLSSFFFIYLFFSYSRKNAVLEERNWFPNSPSKCNCC